MLPESLKEDIYKQGKFVCGITAKIYSQHYNGDNEYERPLVEEYAFGNKLYGRINSNAFLTMEIRKGKDEKDDIRRRAMILEYEIYEIVDTLSELSSAVASDKIFKLERNDHGMLTYITNAEYVKMFTKQIVLRLCVIGVRPSLVKRRDSTNIEVIEKGIDIVVNSHEYIASLSLNELRYFLNVLKRLDIKARATMMFNQYVLYKILCDSERPSAKIKAFSTNTNNVRNDQVFSSKQEVTTNTIKPIKNTNPFMDL